MDPCNFTWRLTGSPFTVKCQNDVVSWTSSAVCLFRWKEVKRSCSQERQAEKRYSTKRLCVPTPPTDTQLSWHICLFPNLVEDKKEVKKKGESKGTAPVSAVTARLCLTLSNWMVEWGINLQLLPALSLKACVILKHHTDSVSKSAF